VTPETLSSESARFSSPSGHLAEAVGSQSTAACPTAAFGCRRWTTCAGSACRASGDSARSISAVLRRAEPAPETTGLDQALARAGDGAFVIGGDGRILLWNRSAERVLGYAARDVLGRPCCEVFAGYDDDGNRLCYQGCHVASLVRMDEPIQSFDMRTRTKPGRPVWINVSVLRTTGERGAPLTIHLFRDVTATKELLALVHERLSPRPAASPGGAEPAALSRRELDVLRLMTDGLNTSATAERLHLSGATVRNHVQNILGKLGVHSRLEAVAFAARHRLF
jgi:PAS domain S-box-containing protein